MLARGKSYRAKDSELVRFDQPWARLDCDLRDSRKRTVKLRNDSLEDKIYELDGKIYKRLSLGNTLPAVLFEPNDLRLLTGSPEYRRDYIDNLLEQTVQGYVTLRRQYRRTLAQRNALLKQYDTTHRGQFFTWDLRLAELAGKIVRNRVLLVEQLNNDITSIYQAISGTKSKVNLVYGNQWPVENYESQLMKSLDINLSKDVLRGFTSNGPHREDLVTLFDNHPIQHVASRGEMRSSILSLKIIELKIIELARQITPLLLFDDVYSELDGKRRHALSAHITNYQTFITTTDADLLQRQFTEDYNIIPLKP
jgi:DNA replication and repair protein RecF